MSTKKKLFSNGIANVLQKVVRVAEQLFLVPFFITAWGADYYGEWLTLTIIPSILAFSDLGFGSAAANTFVLRYASGDKDGAANVGTTGFSILTGIVLIMSCLSILTLGVLSHFHLFDKSLISATDAVWSVGILIIARLLGFYLQLSEAYYRAARKAALSINLTTLYALLNMGGGLFVLLGGFKVIAFSFSQLIVSVVFVTYYGITAKKVLNLSATSNGKFKMDDARMITQKGLGYLMSPVWQAIYFQGSTFVVRIVLGPESVAIYNTVRTLTRSINQLYNMINSAVFPELQYELGAGNNDKVQKLFRLSLISVFLLAVVGAAALWLLGPWFYRLWTNNELVVPEAVWVLFIIGVVLNALWWTAAMVFRAFNKPYQFAAIGLISALLSVVSSYFLSQLYGLTGAALGGLVFEVLMAFYILPLCCKLLQVPLYSVIVSGTRDLWELNPFVKKHRKTKSVANS